MVGFGWSVLAERMVTNGPLFECSWCRGIEEWPYHATESTIMAKASKSVEATPNVWNDDDNVTVRFHITRDEEPKQDRKAKYVEIIEVVKLPFLLPFGVTTIRVDKMRKQWNGRCGHFSVCGSGTNVDKITALFVNLFHEESKAANAELNPS